MSDKMQATRRSKDQKDHKGSKFAEGRLKLSTSCTECHRRKQKCDQKQPCRHCARRFPQPQCIYRSANDSVSPAVELKAPSQAEIEEDLHQLRPPLSRVDSNKSNAKSSASPYDFSPEKVVTGGQQNDRQLAARRISPDSLDDWGPSEYQDLLSTMVENIADTVQSGSSDTSPPQPGSAGPRSRSPTSSQSVTYSGDGGLVPFKRVQGQSRSPSVVSPPSHFSITSVDPLHFLGITPTYRSGELLQAFLRVITKYVVSIDGSPKPNYYNDIWVPWCMKSPLLAYLGIFTASCYQSEAQKVPPAQSPVVLAYKLKSIGLLNEMLRNKATATSAEAITAVTYLLTNEWYWSNYENVQAHMKGLKEMVRLRGGLGDLGMSGFLRKMIVLVDYHVACSYNLEVSFPHNVSSHVRYPASMSTPLLYSLTNFSSISEELEIAIETAAILDDMRFVTMAVLRLLDTPQTEDEIVKLSTTSSWIQTKILSLPDGSDPSNPLSSDNIYKSCRIAALIYCRAIVQRISLSKACTIQDLNQLWSCMWRVTLTRWKQTPGVFVWIILSGNQAAQDTPHGRFLKSMFKAATSYIALDHFDVVDGSLMTYTRMQRWLRVGREGIVEVGSSEDKPRAMSFLHNYK